MSTGERYVLFDVIASGGMASVHFGRMNGAGGFSRTVAIKRLHPHLAGDLEFNSMLLDEGRIAARISHPNVVSTIDVVAEGRQLLLVMEYVRGETLSNLLARANGPVSRPILAAIFIGVLAGLDAAHDARDEEGRPLGIVHRDVSPQNVIVGIDGLARVSDFGIAKALSRAQTTRDGALKGKLGYMAPEQIERGIVDRRADVYSIGVMLWEALCGRRLFVATDTAGLVSAVLAGEASTAPIPADDLSPEVASVVRKALSRAAVDRYPTAHAMADALEAALVPATPREVAAWVRATAHDALSARETQLLAIERATVRAPIPLPAHLVKISEDVTQILPAAATRRRGAMWILVGIVALLLFVAAIVLDIRVRSAGALEHGVFAPPSSSAVVHDVHK